MRGRPPKPTELLKLLNNPGKRKIPTDTPQPDKLYNIPRPPKGLNKTAKERWKYLAERLSRCGILTEIDLDVLAACCSSLSIATDAAEKLSEEGLTIETFNENGSLREKKKSPYLTVFCEALMIFDKFGAKLGLSPSDRVRLRGIGKKEDDEFDEFLKTGKAANA